MKLYQSKDSKLLLFECPACGFGHHVDPTRWEFNGNLEKPTCSPSFLVKGDEAHRCHFFMKDGYLQFLDDCTHHLKNQTVEMTECD